MKNLLILLIVVGVCYFAYNKFMPKPTIFEKIKLAAADTKKLDNAKLVVDQAVSDNVFKSYSCKNNYADVIVNSQFIKQDMSTNNRILLATAIHCTAQSTRDISKINISTKEGAAPVLTWYPETGISKN